MRTRLRPSQRGFTLIELMGVIVIVGVLSSVALSRFKSQPSRDAALLVNSLIIDARQRALIGGPVRPDVVTATGVTARTRLEFAIDGQTVTEWVLVENPLPAATAQWVSVQTARMPKQSEIYGVALTASMEAAAVAPTLISTSSGSIFRQFYSNGTADAMTVYLDRPIRGGSQRDKYRVLVFPISAIPTLLEQW